MTRKGVARVAAALAVALVVTLAASFRLAEPLELVARDALLHALPDRPASRTVVVAIDEASLRSLGPWPWPRATLARLVERVAAAGAEAVAVDVLLADSREGDADLAAAFALAPSVAAAALDEDGRWILPSPSLRATVDAVHASFERDHDGVLRRIATTKQAEGLALPALAVHLASAATGRPVPAGRSATPAFRVVPGAIPVVSAREVLEGHPSALDRVAGRIVLIGPTALAIGDRVVTPRSRRTADAGVLVHAAATEALIAGDVITSASPIAAGLLAAALVGGWAAARRLRAAARFAAAIFVTAAPILALIAGAYVNLTFDGVTVAMVVAVVVTGSEVRALARVLRQGRSAAGALETSLGIRGRTLVDAEIGPRLEDLAAAIARRRAEEIESKRVLTHELQTPLAAIRNLSEVLAGFELNEDERRRVGRLLGDEAGKLQAMVGGLLDLERLALRDFGAASREVELDGLVSDRLALLRRGIGRPIEITARAAATVRADPVLLERVLDNLVSNADRYSPEGSVISVSVSAEGGLARVDVADRGPGVPESERARILRRFARGSAARGTEGLGLGLAMVDEVVRWHGGALEVLDRPGGGSVFRVSLPRVTASRRAEAV